MATDAANLAAAQSSLALAAAQAAARLAELDAVAVSSRARLTYSEGGMTYDWNGYRAVLVQQIQSLGEQIEAIAKAAQIIGGPFTVVGRAGG